MRGSVAGSVGLLHKWLACIVLTVHTTTCGICLHKVHITQMSYTFVAYSVLAFAVIFIFGCLHMQEWAVTNHARVGSGGGSKKLAEPADLEDLSLDREKSPLHFTPEYLTLCSKDGSTYQLSVEGGKLKNLTQTPLHVSEEGGVGG